MSQLQENPTDEQIDLAMDEFKDRHADDHLGVYSDDEDAWECRGDLEDE
jgi:hypothetical protein